MVAAMSGQAGEARIASRMRPSGMVVRRRSAQRSVPSAWMRAMFFATACSTPAAMAPRFGRNVVRSTPAWLREMSWRAITGQSGLLVRWVRREAGRCLPVGGPPGLRDLPGVLVEFLLLAVVVFLGGAADRVRDREDQPDRHRRGLRGLGQGFGERLTLELGGRGGGHGVGSPSVWSA